MLIKNRPIPSSDVLGIKCEEILEENSNDEDDDDDEDELSELLEELSSSPNVIRESLPEL